jgi:hypothetical protein
MSSLYLGFYSPYNRLGQFREWNNDRQEIMKYSEHISKYTLKIFLYTRRFLTFLTASRPVRFAAAGTERRPRVLPMNQSTDRLQSSE